MKELGFRRTSRFVMRDHFQTVSLVKIESKTPLLGLGILLYAGV